MLSYFLLRTCTCLIHSLLLISCRDRCRTSINVWGDSIGAGIMHAAVGDDLDAELMEEDQPEKFAEESKGKQNQAYQSGGMINVQL